MNARKTRRILQMPQRTAIEALVLRHSLPKWCEEELTDTLHSVVEMWNDESNDANASPGPKGGRPARTWIGALSIALHEVWIENGCRPGIWEQGAGPPSAELQFLVHACKLLDVAVSAKTIRDALLEQDTEHSRIPVKLKDLKAKKPRK